MPASGAVFLTALLLLSLIGCDKTDSAPAGTQPSSTPPVACASVAPTQAVPGFDDKLLASISGKTIGGQALDTDGHPVKDAVVSIKDGLAPAKYPAPKDPAVVDQRDKNFVPRVLPVLAGTTVEFKNNDSVLHNVYSRSGVKTFDLGAYSNKESKSTVFDKPGRVDVFCAIHTNMHAVVLVFDNPYFAKTDDRGYFEIRNVPEGSYTVALWSDAKGETEAHAAVTPDQAGVLRVKFP